MKIPRTTLCYISRDDEWLFIRKTRKSDNNEGKYLGIGGHIEEGESPDDCIVREIYEETGLTADDITDLRYMGRIDFSSNEYGDEEMNVYLADIKKGIDPTSYKCDEGELIWIKKKKAFDLPIWEGDKLMFDHLLREKRFQMRLKYEGEVLAEADVKTL